MNMLPEHVREAVYGLKRGRRHPVCAYLYDIQHLQMHLRQIRCTLPACCSMYYAMKANDDAGLLKVLASEIHGFEVASFGEVEKARAASPSLPVLFGGPGKSDDELEGAIQQGVTLIHVESLHELRRLNYLASHMGKVVPVLLRANLRSQFPEATLKMAGQPTQFGIDEQEMPEAIRLCDELRHIELQGFHFHSLSNNLDAQLHLQVLETYLRYIHSWVITFHLQISIINVGGGIGVNFADFSQQFDWPRFSAGLQHIEAVLPAGWKLLFECGRYLVSSCGYYAVEVLDIKQNHGKYFVIVNGGTHHFRLPSSWGYSHPFIVLPVDEWRYPFDRVVVEENVIMVAGQLCSPKDVLARDVAVERIRIGDILVFPYTGAYGWTISHHDFLSHPHPEVIYLDNGLPV
jgi:diaminopimelate decarboxylase